MHREYLLPLETVGWIRIPNNDHWVHGEFPLTTRDNNTKKEYMNIEELTIGQVRELQKLLGGTSNQTQPHPMVGRRCLIRTYSAGVHIGDVMSVKDGMEVHLMNALRLWSWKDGGLSLSAIANNGVKSARINKTGEVFLTNVIEFIPTTKTAEETYAKFIED